MEFRMKGLTLTLIQHNVQKHKICLNLCLNSSACTNVPWVEGNFLFFKGFQCEKNASCFVSMCSLYGTRSELHYHTHCTHLYPHHARFLYVHSLRTFDVLRYSQIRQM